MLAAKRLEAMIELEDKLKAEYQSQIEAKDAEIAQITKEKDEQRAALAKQLEQIKTLSVEASANKKLEQQNRELFSRCDNLKEEIEKQKQRTKNLQRDLDRDRAELAELKKFDPAKMKKNLDASKKKLAERTAANDLLQKNLSKAKTENAELQAKVKELEAKLAELEQTEEAEA
jgi:septal ring factor EnvC (AmiA/AmiB activator)